MKGIYFLAQLRKLPLPFAPLYTVLSISYCVKPLDSLLRCNCICQTAAPTRVLGIDPTIFCVRACVFVRACECACVRACVCGVAKREG